MNMADQLIVWSWSKLSLMKNYRQTILLII